MTSVEDEFYLDLNKVTLFGWEPFKNYDYVSDMIDSIEEGKNFFPVPVGKINENTYSLVWGVKDRKYNLLADGGHNRALAHYITSVPLKCELYPFHPLPDNNFRIPISEIILKI